MLKYNLRIALRCLIKYRTNSVINVLGLAMSIAVCLLMWLYVRDELSYDGYHQDANRVFRVIFRLERDNENPVFATAPGLVASTLRRDFPQVERVARFAGGPNLVVRFGAEKVFYENGNYFYADPELFQVFSIPFIYGDPNTALTQGQSVVVSTDMAYKYFGGDQPMGKILKFSGKDWTVTGVFEDIPHNSHLPKFKIISSIKSVEDRWFNAWDGLRAHTYIKLKARVDASQFEKQIRYLSHQYNGEKLQALDETHTFFLQPIKDIHLHSHLIQESGTPGSVIETALFAAIAFLILLIACSNYINLATVRSASRIKEVGISKILGATQSQLVRRFLVESIILSLVALVLALGIVELVLPTFNVFSGKEIHLSPIPALTLAVVLAGIITIVGIVAGCYTAFLLASFRPVTILRGELWRGVRAATSRKGIIIFQFVVSIALIIAVLVIHQQLRFVRQKDLGFDKEQMLVLPIQDWDLMQRLSQNMEGIKKEFLQHHAVTSITASLRTPGRMEHHDDIRLQGEGDGKEFGMFCVFVDADFVNAYNIRMAAGRSFAKVLSTDFDHSFLINEAGVKTLGLGSSEDALGRRLSFWNGEGEIIGVAKNFHFSSLHHEIEPLFLFMPSVLFPEAVTLKLKGERPDETVAFVESKWKSLFPGYPFEYFFLDRDFDQQYRADERFGILILIFSGFAVFIACLGLFGLAALLAEQRTKEIGVRKVLGASVAALVKFLSVEFAGMVLLANLIAWPIAWYLMHKWLQNFAYRIEMSWWMFALAGGAALLIALMTVSWQAIRAATANPVESLRYE
jgi:putative ABC transport system permease protein